LSQIKEALVSALGNCTLCPRNCGVNRLKGELGFCRTGRKAIVSSAFLHFGEERELVGHGGSGTIFFSYCNLGCCYCQNYTISHLGEGKELDAHELASAMLALQKAGAENINFVTPTHVIAQIVEALELALAEGLTLPLVYNCGGYEKLETLKTIAGVFDIYMPDIKYSDNKIAEQLSCAPDYWDTVKTALKEMYRQKGDLQMENGVALKGVLVRHLVLPSRLAGSFAILDFIKQEISSRTYVNIMQQYHPCYRAYENQQLSRRVTLAEYREVLDYAASIGLGRQ
jgi:putative pyruvate formate lyase activating enzyme